MFFEEMLTLLQRPDIVHEQIQELMHDRACDMSYEQFLVLTTLIREKSPQNLGLLYCFHPLLKQKTIGTTKELQLVLSDPEIIPARKFNYCVKYFYQHLPMSLSDYNLIHAHAIKQNWMRLYRNYLDSIHPHVIQFQIAGNALGLSKAFGYSTISPEGLFPGLHVPAAHYRWQQRHNDVPLPLYDLTQFDHIPEILSKASTSTHGDLLSLCFRADESKCQGLIRTTTAAPYHVASLHLINDHEEMHMLWLNRGYAPVQDNFFHQRHLWVFTLPLGRALLLLPKILHMLVRGPMEDIQTGLDTILCPYINLDLSFAWCKTAQKVGNCGLANTNFSWHLALCAQLMQQKSLDFKTSYMQSMPAYKAMRAADQIDALKTILTLQDFYISEDAFHQEISHILYKFYLKDPIHLSLLIRTIFDLGDKLSNFLNRVDLTSLSIAPQPWAEDSLASYPSFDNHHRKSPAAIISIWQEQHRRYLSDRTLATTEFAQATP